MLTSKQRAFLRGIAQRYDTIGQVGKGGIGEQLLKQVSDALLARELIKLRVLETCEYSPREAAELIAAQTDSELVFVIGSRFVLYKRHPKKPVIELVPAKDKAK